MAGVTGSKRTLVIDGCAIRVRPRTVKDTHR
jgi:hypothetical protein